MLPPLSLVAPFLEHCSNYTRGSLKFAVLYVCMCCQGSQAEHIIQGNVSNAKRTRASRVKAVCWYALIFAVFALFLLWNRISACQDIFCAVIMYISYLGASDSALLLTLCALQITILLLLLLFFFFNPRKNEGGKKINYYYYYYYYYYYFIIIIIIIIITT